MGTVDLELAVPQSASYRRLVRSIRSEWGTVGLGLGVGVVLAGVALASGSVDWLLLIPVLLPVVLVLHGFVRANKRAAIGDISRDMPEVVLSDIVRSAQRDATFRRSS
jgi:hypothetical protein